MSGTDNEICLLPQLSLLFFSTSSESAFAFALRELFGLVVLLLIIFFIGRDGKVFFKMFDALTCLKIFFLFLNVEQLSSFHLFQRDVFPSPPDDVYESELHQAAEDESHAAHEPNLRRLHVAYFRQGFVLSCC